MRRLYIQLITAKARNVETAGVLLGAFRDSGPGGRPDVFIENCLPLRPEYRTGNLCQYSDSSRSVLEQQLSSGTGGWHAVGFYRSTLRGESELSDDDVRLMKEHFDSPGCVFLLLESSHRHAAGTFFTLCEGELPPARPCYCLPLDARGPAEIMSMPRPGDEPSEDEQPERLHARAPRPAGLVRKIAMALGCLAALAVIVWAALQLRTSALSPARGPTPNPGPPSSAFGLRADRSGSQWRLSWNREAAPVRSASRGHLSITDGVVPREVELSQADLQTGSVIYSPLSDDIRFRLDIYDLERARTISESVRVLGSPWSPSSPPSPGYLDRIPQGARKFPAPAARQPFVPPGPPGGAEPVRHEPRSLPAPPALAPPAAINAIDAAPPPPPDPFHADLLFKPKVR